MRFVKPLDVELDAAARAQHDAFVTVEENVVAGGAGSAVAEALAAARRRRCRCCISDCPTGFIDHGDPAVILHECGLDAAGIVDAIERRFGAPQLNTVAKPAA